jgi:hypothetical protein
MSWLPPGAVAQAFCAGRDAPHVHVAVDDWRLNFVCKVWELDKKLLQQHALPLVASYIYETATVIRSLDMDECLPPAALRGPAGPPLQRKALRSGSHALRGLVDMVGRSRQVSGALYWRERHGS